MVGAAFLTVAGWITLVPMIGLETTAFVISAIYFGLGLILLGVASSSDDSSTSESVSPSVKASATSSAPKPDSPTSPEAPPLMQAFMYGLQAGSQAEKARH
ncbi:hypothetical protein V8J84_02200 [Yoonia sp. 208BN28-4]